MYCIGINSRTQCYYHCCTLNFVDVVQADVSVIGSNALLVLPGGSKAKNVPLIVFPHGGPHSWQQDEYSQEVAFFVACGEYIHLPYIDLLLLSF
jgi:hypothetical protein